MRKKKKNVEDGKPIMVTSKSSFSFRACNNPGCRGHVGSIDLRPKPLGRPHYHLKFLENSGKKEIECDLGMIDLDQAPRILTRINIIIDSERKIALQKMKDEWHNIKGAQTRNAGQNHP